MSHSVRSLLNRFPRLKQLLKRLLQWVRPTAGVSSHYVLLDGAEAGREAGRLRAAWQSGDLPGKQRELVARQFAIFHRTPVVLGQPDTYYRKQAYGVETVEIHFNEPLFLALLASCGLELVATYTLGESIRNGVGTANRTYVCKKMPR